VDIVRPLGEGFDMETLGLKDLEERMRANRKKWKSTSGDPSCPFGSFDPSHVWGTMTRLLREIVSGVVEAAKSHGAGRYVLMITDDGKEMIHPTVSSVKYSPKISEES
jgi:hypothetical protein